MPKAKPTQVIVHRLELQETERATLEAALAGKFVTNAVSSLGSVISGFANVLKPFEGAITALAVVWIGERGWQALKDEILDPIVQAIRAPHIERAVNDYEAISAWLNATYAMGGWDAVLEIDSSTVESYMNSHEFQSAMWRQGGLNHPTFGELSFSHRTVVLHFAPNDPEGWRPLIFLDGWLVDRFDSFIWMMKNQNLAADSDKTAAEFWVEFFPFSEFENQVIWHVKNRGSTQYET